MHSMGTAARVAVATGGSAVGNYSMIAFTSWDYGCLGDQATRLKQKRILYRLQVRGDLSCTEDSYEKQRCGVSFESFPVSDMTLFPLSGGSGGGKLKEEDSRSDFEAKNHFLLSTCFHVFGCIWPHYRSLIRHLCSHCLQPGKQCKRRTIDADVVFGLKDLGDFLPPISYKQERSGDEGILGLFFEYLPSIVITVGNFLVPLLCDQIALLERYSPSTTIIVALLRFAPVFL